MFKCGGVFDCGVGKNTKEGGNHGLTGSATHFKLPDACWSRECGVPCVKNDDKHLPIMAGAGLGSCDDGAAGLQLWLSLCPKWKEHRLETNC